MEAPMGWTSMWHGVLVKKKKEKKRKAQRSRL
jgi:hypothetical protein